ncbi:MAG: YdiU family protein [Gammaproteobacteria bacterium]|nr:YdiU family protein [Gammaproteobacteria bacterium]MCP5198733.1 YdiU family protein [Gammaproteobacteria bacterium]
MAELRFDNRFVAELPGDPESANFRRQVAGACWSSVAPTAVAAPRLVAVADEVLALLDLPPAAAQAPLFAEVFAGNRLLDGMQPHATCYGGHQFGNWAGQLGDGRAINLGEIVNADGERWILQLKGAGPTPYSRGADGLAVLRSSVREFLCSEAMHHLGVPTTRALSLVLTGETVVRDMFYDGNPRPEPGAVVCRVAPSFTRFGHFEIHAARGDHALLQRLADYTIRTDFPHLGEPGDDPAARRAGYVAWFDEVCQRTARLIAEWMRVGFVHGVMNTDNLSILGLTIDYGPYGWLDDYDPDWTPNTTDAQGRRYRYGQQPQVALWNLLQLANALHPLIGDSAPLERALEDYGRHYESAWRAAMAAKLGLAALDGDDDQALVEALFGVLTATETDMTLFYRTLNELDPGSDATGATLVERFAPAWYRPEHVDDDYRARLARWLDDYRARVRADALAPAGRAARMRRANPLYVMRNYLAQLAIDRAEQGDFGGVRELLDVMRRPYDPQPGREAYAAPRPDWARSRAGCSMLSCSS